MALLNINTREQFEQWLSVNFDFADAYVLCLSPTPKLNSSDLPSEVTIDLAYRIEGGYKAHSTRVSRVFRVHAHGIAEYRLAGDGTFSPQHCSEGIEILESESLIAFQIGVPSLLTLRCSGMAVEELPDFTETVGPWLSDREVFAIIPSTPMPTPPQWQTRFTQVGQDVVWHIYGDAPKKVEEVPASAYEGWFLQARKDMDETHQGIFFFSCKPHGNGFRVQIQNQGASDTLWQAAMTTVAAFDGVQIHCGNCEFSGTDFLREWKNWNKARQGGAGNVAPHRA